MADFSIDSISRFFQNKRDQQATTTNSPKKERRAAKQDRRQSVNDGVIVHLSTQPDRRSGRDRRHNK